jgi:hypothetical protein
MLPWRRCGDGGKNSEKERKKIGRKRGKKRKKRETNSLSR